MEKVTANIVKRVTKNDEKAIEILAEKKELNQASFLKVVSKHNFMIILGILL